MISQEEMEQFLKDAEAAHAEYEAFTQKPDPNWVRYYASYLIQRFKQLEGIIPTPAPTPVVPLTDAEFMRRWRERDGY